MHDSCWSRAMHGLGGCPLGRSQQQAPGTPAGVAPGPAVLTASWRSSRADSVEWPPSSACQLGPRRGRSRSSGSAAPAAQTPAPTASVSPAGTRAGPAAASGAPGPAGSRSGPGRGLGGCPVTLWRAESLSAASSLQPQEPAWPHRRDPAQAKPSRIPTAPNPPGRRGPERHCGDGLVWGPHQAPVQTRNVPR